MKKTKNPVTKLIVKHGDVVKKVAQTEAEILIDWCKILFYQPEIPDGLEEFVKNNKKH